MTILLVTLHVLVCIALIIVVLLQSGKGAEMGASFGASGSQSVFGAGGGNTFMSKLTTSAAIIFMLTSLSLAFVSSKGGGSSIMSSKRPKAGKPAPMGGMPLQAPGKVGGFSPSTPAAPKDVAPGPQGAAPAAPAAPAKK
ncbi:preprotein translocase subunit SecG [Geomesophilobacter sediminis]|uniref:Protein-export membrane protein SecG n=1 Tax=Geomesophilobacter sediminis TaxID=2798584 RepID=A0A8J7LWT4_9BACT|nr:preprotein translocase subunit SecG [Geomesophilobacter sediminis]MBJ6726220.1 preprotein translocase subunit SecG [Geomesophilobacter sediminis]